MLKPFCTILAGPNGSGKSSIYQKLQPPGEFVNADEISKALPADLEGSARQVKAGLLIPPRIGSDALLLKRKGYRTPTNRACSRSSFALPYI
jgi:predicted ABC-type ATPase